MDAESEEVSWLDYFSGGVPTGEYFRMQVEHLRGIVKNTSGPLASFTTGVTYIGLVAYFEAFCKDHFASIINIVPVATKNLAARGHNTTIDATIIVEAGKHLSYQLGFVLAENYDFGTASKINALYNALLLVTPFSKDEAVVFDRILRDRNLLVHHGGTYTTSYAKAMAKDYPGTEGPKPLWDSFEWPRPFWDSLVILPDHFHDDAAFMEGIVRKILRTTHAAATLLAREQPSPLDAQRQKALDAFRWWGSEGA